jgi:uncharacterized protein
MVVSENYPHLKADGLFQNLQAQLEGTENRVTVARNRYVQSVQDYNSMIRTFPNNLTAKMFGYQVKPNFSVDNEKAISTAPDGGLRQQRAGARCLGTLMMLRRFPRLLLLLAMALLSPVLLHAADAVPKLARHVTDLTGTLTAAQVDQLDTQLVTLEKAKGAQLVVLMVGTTQPQDIDEYSLAVAEANKIGRKGTDDGVLLLSPRTIARCASKWVMAWKARFPMPRPRASAANTSPRNSAATTTSAASRRGRCADPADQRRAVTAACAGRSLSISVPASDCSTALMIGCFVALFLRSLLGRANSWVRAPLGALLTGGLLWLLVSMGAGIIGALMGGVLMLLPGGAGRFDRRRWLGRLRRLWRVVRAVVVLVGAEAVASAAVAAASAAAALRGAGDGAHCSGC